MNPGHRAPGPTSEPESDPDNVLGNHYDKYRSRNPIARRLMQGFLDAVTELYHVAAPRTVLEVGCGEGELAAHLWQQHPPERFEICDLSLDRLTPELPPQIHAREASIYSLPWADASVDLVICCEVLEHLHDPAAGLAELARVARHHVLLSTPWEPMWRVLNLARGHYVRALGNTPGHVQHFSRRALTRLAQKQLRLLAQRTPLPWTVLLGSPKARTDTVADAPPSPRETSPS